MKQRVFRQDEDNCSYTIVTLSQGGWCLDNVISTRYQKPGVITFFETNEPMNMPTFEVIDPKTGEKKTCIALIRKLTERECGRLMGVDDADITTIQQSGVCRSEQYKLYGNSIVEDVLYHIFRKLLIQPENESPQQLLF